VSELLAIAKHLTEGDRAQALVRMEALGALERVDPELASQLLELFGDRTRAANWLCRRSSFAESPFQLVATGDRQQVVSAITRINHGMFV